ncbi:MAG: hypothetical protein OXI64_05930 [Defluviicoccus sp.]|nr:hypothetical protein [Defluviicoccus sp.]MDE0334479.1 hypothetical protein [Defluviicoccus sp.]
MSIERENAAVGDVGHGGAVPASDDALDAFSTAMSQASEVRKRGAAMMATDEASYLAAAEQDEDYQEEIRAALEASDHGLPNAEEADGASGGSEEYVRVRVPALAKSSASRVDDGAGARSAGEAGPGLGPERSPESGREVVEGKPESAAGGMGSALAGEIGKELEGPDVATLADVRHVLGAGIRLFGQRVEQGIAEMTAAVPRLAEGEVAELVTNVKKLERAIRVHEADEARRRDVGRSWWRWPLRALVVAALLGMFAGGLAVQSRWSVMDDGTNGWKDIVWQSHGMRIAECMDRAERRGGGAKCAVRVGVR